MATINKTELTALIADKMGKSKADAKSALDAVLDTLTDELVKGNEVSLIGFANFKVVETQARTGRNPSTGAVLEIPAKKVVKVTLGKGLKDAVNH
jgi:DNA-binding protein HU-beta